MQISVNLHHLQQQKYSLDKELREVRALRSALEQWQLAAGYSPKIRQLLRAAEQEEECIRTAAACFCASSRRFPRRCGTPATAYPMRWAPCWPRAEGEADNR